MVFGEIVEPSTRALIDEDLEEYPDYTESVPNWEGLSEPPTNIDSLIFIETKRIISLFQSCILKKQSVSKISNAGIEVYNTSSNKYVIVFSQKSEFTCGEITELFQKWIRTAKHVTTITSDSIYNYQNNNLAEKPASLIKMLTNDPAAVFDYGRLESPNLVTGLGASVLSFCIHSGLKCNLFITYVDTSPSDSLNMGPLLDLFKRINLPVDNSEVKTTPSTSNLYM